MTLDDDARQYLILDATDSTVDLGTATIAVKIGTTVYPATWSGAATQTGARWSRSARTDVRFCGSAATPVGTDVQLPAGSRPMQLLVTTSDGQVIAADHDTLESH